MRHVIFGGMLLLAGCSSVLAPQADRSRFYVLTPAVKSAPPISGAATHSAPMVIGLGPITLPPYLDREQVVTRVAPNQVELSNRDFWAAPLAKSFAEVLSEDLSRTLNDVRIVRFPWYPSTKLDYTVAVTVTRFEGEADSSAVLVATWTVKEMTGARAAYNGQSNITEPIGRNESAATALSRALGRLSSQIATRVRMIKQPT